MTDADEAQGCAQASLNDMRLDGVLLESPRMTRTPTGRTVAALELEHRSEAPGQSVPNAVFRLTVVALDRLAESRRDLAPGTVLRVSGRLNQQRWIREGRTRWGRYELLAESIEPLEAPPIPASGAVALD